MMHIHHSATGGPGGGDAPAGGAPAAGAFNAAAENARLVAEVRALRSEHAAAQSAKLLGDAFSATRFASETHRAEGMASFTRGHSVELGPDGRAMAVTSAGQRMPLADAIAAWKNGAGSLYVAAAAQPGAGAPFGLSPSSEPMTIATMPDEQFDKLLEKGVTGELTPGGPQITLQRSTNRFAQGRTAWLSQAWGGFIGTNLPGGGSSGGALGGPRSFGGR